LNSQPGDWVGGGQRIARSGPNTNMTIQTIFNEGAQIQYSSTNPVSNWSFNFTAPGGQVLTPGVYEHATRWPSQLLTEPELAIYGDGRACDTVTGRFVVLDVERVGDQYTRFAADFEQHCEGQAPALFGSVRLNSVVPSSERPIAIQSFKANVT